MLRPPFVVSIISLIKRIFWQAKEFSKYLLDLLQKRTNLDKAEKNLENLETNVNYQSINKTSSEIDDARKEFFDKLDKTSTDYKNELDRVSRKYEKEQSQEVKDTYVKKLNGTMNDWQKQFQGFKDLNDQHYKNLMWAIERQMLADKDATLNERLLLQNLVDDICDMILFMYFGNCSDLELPDIGDSYNERIKKLSYINWQLIEETSKNAASMFLSFF